MADPLKDSIQYGRDLFAHLEEFFVRATGVYDATAGHEPPSRDLIHRLVLTAGVLTTKHGRRGPVALVVRDPDLTRMGKRYATLGELAALNARIFTTVREAEDWLGQAS